MKKMVMKKGSEKNVSKKNIPLGLEILAILMYVCSAFAILGGIYLIAVRNYILTILSENPQMLQGLINDGISAEEIEIISSNLPSLIIMFGIFLLIIGIVNIFIAWGLWKRKNWARIITLVLSCLGVVTSLINVFEGDFISLATLIINGIVVWYLGFNKNVRNYFKK